MRRIDYTVSGDLKHSPEMQTVHVTPTKGRSSPIVYRETLQLKSYPMALYDYQPLNWLNEQDLFERHSFVANNIFTNNPRRWSVNLIVPQRRTSNALFPAGTDEFSDLEMFIRNYENESTNV